jgi:hypothetical protein
VQYGRLSLLGLSTFDYFPDIYHVLNGRIRGIITTLASICFSASIGRWIDHEPNRLKTLLSTITTNRLSAIAACVFWVFIVGGGNADLQERYLAAEPLVSPISSTVTGIWKGGFFGAVLLLGVFEKLSGAANMISMERDWVVTVAAPDGHAYDLTRLNAAMRRIDLVCKLVAPIVLSVIISASGSVQIGVLVVGGMSAASWTVEWWCARRVCPLWAEFDRNVMVWYKGPRGGFCNTHKISRNISPLMSGSPRSRSHFSISLHYHIQLLSSPIS